MMKNHVAALHGHLGVAIETMAQVMEDKDCSLIVKNLLPDGAVRGWSPEPANANQPAAS